MKKTISIITFFVLIVTCVFTGNSYATDPGADSTVDMNVEVDKTTVRPGENVQVRVNFSKNLGTYTVKVAYDKNIFEYVSAEGGTANDTTDKVNVVFHDETGGSSTRTSMSVTFKAKGNITTSNPTEFTVTAEGLANGDVSETYDDITTPVVKNVTVEPAYVDYTFTLKYPEKVIVEKENDMQISYSSPMGRYYEKARLKVDVTTPAGATVKLLGKDEQGLEHDLVESGWGDAQGYKIGGLNVEQPLNVKGIFSKIGTYGITLKLIDRENSDTIIASKTFQVTVTEETANTPTVETPATTNQPDVSGSNNVVSNTASKPKTLPKTGNNIYIAVISVIVLLSGAYIYYNRKNKI